MNKTIEEAAKEARIASAQTLTTHGLHSSIDNIPFIAGKLSYDEVAESAFVKGAEWILSLPLASRLTAEEKERIVDLYNMAKSNFKPRYVEACQYEQGAIEALESIFGADFLRRKNDQSLCYTTN